MKKFLLFALVGTFIFCSYDSFSQKKKDKKNDNVEADGVSENSLEDPISEEEINKFSTPFIQTETHGLINWTNQYIEARGESVIDTVRFKNYGQARAMAIRGAVVVAQRNLLEIIKGVHVTGETTVENMIATNDVVFSKVEGVIKGAQTFGEPVEKYGMMEVTMRVMIYENNGLAPAVFTPKSASASNKPEEPSGKATAASQKSSSAKKVSEAAEKGFVFNLNGKTYDPALFPVVVGEDGKVLMDLSKTYDPKAGKFPKVMNTSKEIFELASFKKGMEVIDIVETQPGKLVVANASKSKINWSKVGNTAAKVGKFLLMLL
jgi:hypothetical protein